MMKITKNINLQIFVSQLGLYPEQEAASEEIDSASDTLDMIITNITNAIDDNMRTFKYTDEKKLFETCYKIAKNIANNYIDRYNRSWDSICKLWLDDFIHVNLKDSYAKVIHTDIYKDGKHIDDETIESVKSLVDSISKKKAQTMDKEEYLSFLKDSELFIIYIDLFSNRFPMTIYGTD